MVASGTAAASAASSGSWGWYSQASKLKPISASVRTPARNWSVAIICSNGRLWPLRTSSLASQAVAWRTPRKRPPPASSWAASTSATAPPSIMSAWPTIPAILGPPAASAASASAAANTVSPTGCMGASRALS